MDRRLRLSTPVSWAARLGRVVIPVFFVWGLLLGVVARAWMRLIATDPGFTWSGTSAILISFAVFATLQSLAALAAARPWRDWPRRAARVLGFVALLPLFQAAGTVMAPAVLLAGLALWHPRWPKAVRAFLALAVLAFLVAVSWLLFTDLGLSVRFIAGVLGLLVVYGLILWTSQGTFAPPRNPRRAPLDDSGGAESPISVSSE